MRQLRKAAVRSIVQQKRREKKHQAVLERQRYARIVRYLGEHLENLEDIAYRAAIFSGGSIEHHLTMVEHILSSSSKRGER